MIEFGKPCEKATFILYPSERIKLYSRKEVIQPQVLLRLPCYDFTPVADSTVGDN